MLSEKRLVYISLIVSYLAFDLIDQVSHIVKVRRHFAVFIFAVIILMPSIVRKNDITDQC